MKTIYVVLCNSGRFPDEYHTEIVGAYEDEILAKQATENLMQKRTALQRKFDYFYSFEEVDLY